MLTVNVPLGLQFGANPGSIVNQSVVGLAVQRGRSLALVGGEVALKGGILFTSDGQIELGSVAGNSQVNLIPISTGYTLGYEGVENFQDIHLTQRAIVLTDANVGGGSIQVQGRNVTLTDGSAIATITSGDGKGGNLIVNATDSVQVIGTSADGEFASNLAAQANPNSTGAAGDLSITTARLFILDGAQVSAGTFGAGKGGNLTVRASDSVELIGTSADSQARSGLFTSAPDGGIAGDLSVETRQMSVQDGARVTVSSPSGQAGNLTITANSLSLNRGTILAETGKSTAEGGANITLQGLDLLRMDNESLISANALEDANGGNVTIDSTFIVATPPTSPEGSDITANAVRGNGGRVRITTQGLFGIEFRPQRTPNNDITASSDFGIAGEVAINSPDVDPSRGLAELPTEVVDATNLIDRRCIAVAKGHGCKDTLPVVPLPNQDSCNIVGARHCRVLYRLNLIHHSAFIPNYSVWF